MFNKIFNLSEILDALRVETQKLEAIYQKKIVEELKKSILQKAFSGELAGSELVGAETETCHAV